MQPSVQRRVGFPSCPLAPLLVCATWFYCISCFRLLAVSCLFVRLVGLVWLLSAPVALVQNGPSKGRFLRFLRSRTSRTRSPQRATQLYSAHFLLPLFKSLRQVNTIQCKAPSRSLAVSRPFPLSFAPFSLTQSCRPSTKGDRLHMSRALPFRL